MLSVTVKSSLLGYMKFYVTNQIVTKIAKYGLLDSDRPSVSFSPRKVSIQSSIVLEVPSVNYQKVSY